MRFLFYFPLFLIGLSCGCLKEKKGAAPWPKPVFPNAKLKEIIFIGSYYPANPNRLKEIKENYIKQGLLKKGEFLGEKYPYLLDEGDERFNDTEKKYCYQKTKDKDKSRAFKDHFRARLYDKKGNLLSEDFLRLLYPEDYDEEGRYTEDYIKRRYEWSSNSLYALESDRISPEDSLFGPYAVISYLSYDERGYEIRIVRLKGRKELIIESYPYPIPNKASLIRSYAPDDGPSGGYSYNEKSQCHSEPGP